MDMKDSADPPHRRDLTFAQQVLADAALAQAEPPSQSESRQALARMEKSAPW
jgi:hypothetical protein